MCLFLPYLKSQKNNLIFMFKQIEKKYSVILCISFLLGISITSAKETPGQAPTLFSFLEQHDVFSYKVSGTGSYSYQLAEHGELFIDKSPSMSVLGTLPLFKGKRFIGTLGLNYYRTTWDFNEVNLTVSDNYSPVIYDNAQVSSNNFRLSPNLIYLYKLGNKKGIVYTSFKLLGSDVTDWKEQALTTMSYVFLENSGSKTLGLGLGCSFTNWRRFVPYPVIIWNKQLCSNFFCNVFIPHKLHFVYKPNETFSVRTGMKMNTNEYTHTPLIDNEKSELKIKDSYLTKHVSVDKRLINKIWLSGSVGHNTVFSSDIFTLNSSKRVNENKAFVFWASELGVSIRF